MGSLFGFELILLLFSFFLIFFVYFSFTKLLFLCLLFANSTVLCFEMLEIFNAVSKDFYFRLKKKVYLVLQRLLFSRGSVGFKCVKNNKTNEKF